MNCLDAMPLLPDRCIDLILSDLPYGVTANPWDSIIDLDRLWIEYKRIIKPRSAIVLTAQCPFDKLLGMSNREWLRYEWIWEKSRASGFVHAKHAPLKAHENVLVFYQRHPRYNPQFTEGKPYVTGGRARYQRNFGKYVGAVVTTNTGYRYPRSVLRINSEGRPVHPTQKPVALFEYLIRTYTKPGDLVLDSCIGSGTTAIACLNAGRNFVGFELDPDFFQIAQARIAARRAELQSKAL
ncbi:MAG: site-specific DNA-methyltransferase [Planctomycetes bacterium]|nr:site-specific DNA-methyltransferase [Planctomycetota bacterium]